MEPTTITPPNNLAKPLSEFQKLGHNIYLWTPPSYLLNSSHSVPLVVVFAWNAAAAKHIAKYTASYQKLFPTSRLLLIRCYTQDMFRSGSSHANSLKPAMDLVLEHTKSGGEILVHSFSNGGGNQVNEFAKAWKRQFVTMLPMRLQIFDSSPTKGPWMKSHAAISASLPKTVFCKWSGGALVHLLLVMTFVVDLVLWREHMMIALCRELNDEHVFDTKVPRVYLYSRADAMVGFEEADEHADIAKAKGWDVTKVQFEKSPHCGHVREDETKYWEAIMEAWKTGPRHS